MIVLDTSALIYWSIDPTKLSTTARRAIEGAEKILVSSITIWEIALKVKRGKLTLPLPPVEYVERLRHVEKLEFRSVDVVTWLDNIELDWSHRDPADRTIVATAARLDCPLISSDGVIAEFYNQTIW